MASLVWGRDPQEAHDNPYEYEAQDQFVREAKELLSQIQVALDHFTMSFHRDDRSLEKATWMLAIDLNDALLESAQLFVEKRHWTDPDFTDTTCLKKLKESGNGWKDKAAVRGGVSAADS
ncbi:MAG: hypothetical protein JNL19_15750 [Burkholderiales bacterium]|nr:hypothetical protein [Burkholderiales bacterium]